MITRERWPSLHTDRTHSSENPVDLPRLCPFFRPSGPNSFRSTVTNLSEFFEKFRHLNVRSSPELDVLVEQAQELVKGVEPQHLRDNAALRAEISTKMAEVRTNVEALITDVPRRRLVRTRPSANGGTHEAAD